MSKGIAAFVADLAAAGRPEVADLLNRLGVMGGYDIEIDEGVGVGPGPVTGRITGHRAALFDAPVPFRFDEQALDRYLSESESTAVDAYGGGRRRRPEDDPVDPRVAARQLLNVNLDEELTPNYKASIDEIGVDRRRGFFVTRSGDGSQPRWERQPGEDFRWSAEPGLP